MFPTARRSRYLALLLPAAWLCGCARSAVLPPPASVPAPAPSVAPPATSRITPSTPSPLLKIPTPSNPWKPTVKEREWKYIVLHHTASQRGSVESIHQAHQQRKDKSGRPWLGIGYHFVIGNGNGMPDGEIEPTFRWRQQMHGAHAGAGDPAYNNVGIGIVLVGNFEEKPPSSAQIQAVKRLVRTLKAAYGISSNNIIGHRDVKATACPGKLFPMAEVAGNDFGFELSDHTSGPPAIFRVASQEGDAPR